MQYRLTHFASLVVRSLSLLCALLPSTTHAQIATNNEYTLLGYEQAATNNRIARLIEQLANGSVQLEYQTERGYLDSLLAALDISPHSQTLVFSKTSLQYMAIDTDKPRAIYFNDDTYIGFVQNSAIIEVTTMDSKLGAVFYVFNNKRNEPEPFEREHQRCLVCHDSSGTAVGGVPMLMAMSSIYSTNNQSLREVSGDKNVTDKMPIAKRWGGWYVSGLHGKQTHLGNFRLPNAAALNDVDDYLLGNVSDLASAKLLNTTPYPAGTSDIVALLLLEHQLTVQNQITYVKFKAPAVLNRLKLLDANKAESWQAVPPTAQKVLTRMLDELVKVLLFVDAAPLTDSIQGAADFQASFYARQPQTTEVQALRQLNLKTRLFEHPLSYLLFSEQFTTLPPYAKDYVYQQLAAALTNNATSAKISHLSAEQRQALLRVLNATPNALTTYLASAGVVH
jgi:hypothetical protein